MSVVIVGGNERMERKYKEICYSYKCKAKVFTKSTSSIEKSIGTPDLLVLFTGTVSHTMVKKDSTRFCELNFESQPTAASSNALDGIDGTGAVVMRSHSSSGSALKGIMEAFLSDVVSK